MKGSTIGRRYFYFLSWQLQIEIALLVSCLEDLLLGILVCLVRKISSGLRINYTPYHSWEPFLCKNLEFRIRDNQHFESKLTSFFERMKLVFVFSLQRKCYGWCFPKQCISRWERNRTPRCDFNPCNFPLCGKKHCDAPLKHF